MISRTLQELGCIAKAMLFNVCLSDDDLREIGVWHDIPSQNGLSPSVWCRAFLHKVCQRDESVAERVADRLDLRFLDTVSLVRSMGLEEMERAVTLWLADPDGAALPGLLWALCTDPRPEGQTLGVRLCHESLLASCNQLVLGIGGKELSVPEVDH